MANEAPEYKYLRLYDWADKEKTRPLREVPVLRMDKYNRNSKQRILIWSGDPDDFNYVIYPDYDTAYPEFDNKVQQQRYSQRYLYTLTNESLDAVLDEIME